MQRSIAGEGHAHAVGESAAMRWVRWEADGQEISLQERVPPGRAVRGHSGSPGAGASGRGPGRFGAVRPCRAKLVRSV